MDKLTGRKEKKIYRAKCCACGALNQRLLLEDSNGLFEWDSCGAINAAIRKYWDIPQELPSSLLMRNCAESDERSDDQ